MSYLVQGCWRDGRVLCEWEVDNPTLEEYPFSAFDPNIWEKKAIDHARIFAEEPTFEGDYVRVITGDGELVWDSREDDNEHSTEV